LGEAWLFSKAATVAAVLAVFHDTKFAPECVRLEEWDQQVSSSLKKEERRGTPPPPPSLSLEGYSDPLLRVWGARP